MADFTAENCPKNTSFCLFLHEILQTFSCNFLILNMGADLLRIDSFQPPTRLSKKNRFSRGKILEISRQIATCLMISLSVSVSQQ